MSLPFSVAEALAVGLRNDPIAAGQIKDFIKPAELRELLGLVSDDASENPFDNLTDEQILDYIVEHLPFKAVVEAYTKA